MKKNVLIKLLISAFIAFLLIFFIPKIARNISYGKIESKIINDFKKRFPHGMVTKKYRSGGDKESFYFYIDYKEGGLIYNAEYLCQNADKKWEYYFIKTSVLSKNKM